MKTVTIYYPDATGEKRKKTKVPASTKGSILRTYISRDLPNFYNVNYLILFTNSKGQKEILNESIVFSKLSENKKLEFQIVYRNVDVILTTINRTAKTSIDLSQNVIENIKAFTNDNDADKYCLAFRQKDENSFFRIACHQSPLVLQGWYGEDLFLIKRIMPNDDVSDLEEAYKHIILSQKLRLSLYNLNDFATLYALQCVAEEKDEKAFKEGLLSNAPSSKVDDEFMKLSCDAFSVYTKLTPIQAKQQYVDLAKSNCQHCCFIDRVQFMLKDGKWRVGASRFMFVGPNVICIMKEIGSMMQYNKPLSQLTNIDTDGEFLYFTFHGGEKWRVKSRYPLLITDFIKEMLRIYPSQIATKNEPPAATTDMDELSEEHSQADQAEAFIASFVRWKAPDWKPPKPQVYGLSPLIVPDSADSAKGPVPEEARSFPGLVCLRPLNVPEREEVEEPLPDMSLVVNVEAILSFKRPGARMLCLVIILLLVITIFIKKL